MSVQFGIDASSFHGNVNWARADSTTSFGWEKVMQGSRKTASRGYVNPFWAGPSRHSKRAAVGVFPPRNGGYPPPAAVGKPLGTLGSCAVMVVPWPGAERIWSRPPRAASRSAMFRSPDPIGVCRAS
jgi:hypothetical protein